MYYGQNGEDRKIEEIMDALGVSSGICIDIGASHGTVSSNTFYFEQNGWECMCVEPNPDLYAQLKNNRKMTLNCAATSPENIGVKSFHIFTLTNGDTTACSGLTPDPRLLIDHKEVIAKEEEIEVPAFTLDSIIDSFSPSHIDFVSIDTEGTELDVLLGFDLEKWQPKLLVIENNYEDVDIELYLKGYGYRKIDRLAINDFYLREDLEI